MLQALNKALSTKTFQIKHELQEKSRIVKRDSAHFLRVEQQLNYVFEQVIGS